ncbi:hypothetical protein D0B32_15580 [Paraburkholderia sp. DHOC27]|nr:hypothetical protein D0B32_15580 [Paraburkholderia sp. DHOC27]
MLLGPLFGPVSVHATSFDCARGRSIPEQLICHTTDLSRLDDQLGRLYWQARRRVDDPKAFRADSDSKWSWREAHCREEACLRTWYGGRIEELQQLLASLPGGPAGTARSPGSSPAPWPAEPDAASATPAHGLHELPRDTGRRAFAANESENDSSDDHAKADNNGTRAHAPSKHLANNAALAATTPSLQCTAAEPGLVLHDQCPTVLKQNTQWRYPAQPGDWFCDVATLAQTQRATRAQ